MVISGHSLEDMPTLTYKGLTSMNVSVVGEPRKFQHDIQNDFQGEYVNDYISSEY